MEHLEPRTNHRIHRYTLQGIRQEQGESVDNFVAKIKNIAAKCKFRDSKEVEDRILDQLIWGSNNPEVQKSLIGQDEKLSLNDAMDIVRSNEATKRQMNSLLSQNIGQSQRFDSINRTKLNSEKTDSNPIRCSYIDAGKVITNPTKITVQRTEPHAENVVN